ncbi:MAG: START-like domain-containing protein [Imperialibacter sp.]|uniref:START-like domain-containing protein n=1 Tax=Imperialibacter sp. TaxID=2038411 RepID=UPI0032EB6938
MKKFDMGNYKYIAEFEFRASKKMLFPYVSSASGLAQWFADDVNINEDKDYIFIWDGEKNKAKMTSHRANSLVKFVFEGTEENDDPNYVEMKLEENEMTQSTYLKITDYSDMDDLEELEDLWESMIHTLKEIVGG